MNPTKVYCFACRKEHEGVEYEEDGELRCRVECPQPGEHVVTLSSDARLFRRFRERSFSRPGQNRYHLALLHVTDACSMRCPICYAAAGSGAPAPLAELVDFARKAKESGIRNITLTGGEPTEYPELLRLVETCAKTLGLSVSLLTNGLNLSADPAFVHALKTAGVRKIHISFDTLSPETSRAMRGGDHIAAKQRAFELAAAEKFALAANVTVCERNLAELGEVFQWLARSVPGLSHVLFQPFADFGRRNVHDRIDRERVIHALVSSGICPSLREEDFFPSPVVPAKGLLVHADCGALCPIRVRGKGTAARLSPLLTPERMESLQRRLAAVRGTPDWMASVRLLMAWLRAVGPSGVSLLPRWWKGGEGDHVVLAVVDNLPDPEFMLMERIQRCGGAVICRDGTTAPLCAGYRLQRENAWQ